LGVAIDTYVQETFAKAIIGELDIEAEWDNYLATLDSLGLAQYEQAHQEAYDAWRNA
jgi:putative aldouronate transport system substrate-binding protein